MPYNPMDEDGSFTEETFDGQTVVSPTVVVPPGSQTANPVSVPGHRWN